MRTMRIVQKVDGRAVRVTRIKRVDKKVSIEFEVEPRGLSVRGLFTLFSGKLKSNKFAKLNLSLQLVGYSARHICQSCPSKRFSADHL